MRLRFPAVLEVFSFTTVSFVAVGCILSLLSDELELKPSGKVARGVKLTV